LNKLEAKTNKNKTKGGRSPLLQTKNGGRGGSLPQPHKPQPKREEERGRGGAATAEAAPPQCARYPGVSSTSPFIASEGRERMRDWENEREREDGGPANGDGSGRTRPMTADPTSSRDPNSWLATERGVELGPRFRGVRVWNPWRTTTKTATNGDCVWL